MTRQDRKPPSDVEYVDFELPPTQEQLNYVAELVANGELPFPEDLPAEHTRQLLLEVQQRRRQRLVEFIAHAIALDIHQSREP